MDHRSARALLLAPLSRSRARYPCSSRRRDRRDLQPLRPSSLIRLYNSSSSDGVSIGASAASLRSRARPRRGELSIVLSASAVTSPEPAIAVGARGGLRFKLRHDQPLLNHNCRQVFVTAPNQSSPPRNPPWKLVVAVKDFCRKKVVTSNGGF
ncbi:hypothetical protein F2Q69_00062198 [Brassica cretica]|uniref:Uncharacterized protein n=1 Tax=Brassica cretica TaxID=69181 RepID=A0A8S9RLJ5_BRACR|nr:hypothetical protein F2Q69_00062198 [Brassica cretica]